MARESLKVPKKGSDKDKLFAFMERITTRESTRIRERDFEHLEAKALMDNHHWTQKFKGDNRSGPFVRASERADIPKPVINWTMRAVDNECARASRRNSEITVEPSKNSPDSKAGASIGTEYMKFHLTDPEEGIGWHSILRRTVRRTHIYGYGVMKSFLRQDNLDTVKVGVEGALQCAGSSQYTQDPITGQTVAQPIPGCGTTLASRKTAPEHAPNLPFSSVKPRTGFLEGRGGEVEKSLDAVSCPQCGGDLQDFTPAGGQELQSDFLGRPLGQDVPRNTAAVEAVSPLDVFFENEGLDVEPETCAQFAQCTPRDVDLYVKRYYRKNVDKVKPEDPIDIAKDHPILGEYAASSRGASGADSRNIYQNHVRVREFYCDKTVDYPKGRMIVMAGPVVLVDDDLYVQPDNPEEKAFRRVEFSVNRCFPIDGEIYGHGMPYFGASLQKSMNMTKSQIIDAREHRIGGVSATRGMNLVRSWIKGVAGTILRWDPDPLVPNMKPEPIVTGGSDPQWWQELAHDKEAYDEIMGTLAAEVGTDIKGVTTFSQYRLMAEKASERREQREKELIESVTRILQHQLRLIAHYYREARKYKIPAQFGEGSDEKEFIGSQIGGEFGLKVVEQPQYDKSTAEREAAANILQIPQFQPTTAGQRRKWAEVLGVPSSLTENENVQIDTAREDWFAFVNTGEVPGIDPVLDDPIIRFQELGELLLSDDGKKLSKQNGWKQILKAIAGWPEDLANVQAVKAAAKMAGWDGVVPLDQFQAAAMAAEANKQAAYRQQLAQSKAAGPGLDGALQTTPPPPVPTFPPMPMVPASETAPPEAIEDLILWVWMAKLTKKQLTLSAEQEKFAAFQAVVNGYHMLGQGDAGGAIAAPGAQQAPMAPMDPGAAQASTASVPMGMAA